MDSKVFGLFLLFCWFFLHAVFGIRSVGVVDGRMPGGAFGQFEIGFAGASGEPESKRGLARAGPTNHGFLHSG